jgi:hypothetical protein
MRITMPVIMAIHNICNNKVRKDGYLSIRNISDVTTCPA